MPNSKAAPKSSGHRLMWEWRAPGWVFERFQNLLLELVNFDVESDEAYAIRDEIKGLPNFPYEADPDTDLIIMEAIEAVTVH